MYVCICIRISAIRKHLVFMYVCMLPLYLKFMYVCMYICRRYQLSFMCMCMYVCTYVVSLQIQMQYNIIEPHYILRAELPINSSISTCM